MIDNKRHVDYWWCKKYLCFPAVWLLNRPFHTGDLRPTFDIFPKSAKPLFPPKESKGSDGAKGSMFGRGKTKKIRNTDMMYFSNSHTGTEACFCYFLSITETHTHIRSAAASRTARELHVYFRHVAILWLHCFVFHDYSWKVCFQTPLPPPPPTTTLPCDAYDVGL